VFTAFDDARKAGHLPRPPWRRELLDFAYALVPTRETGIAKTSP
jgi:hypothetical protein